MMEAQPGNGRPDERPAKIGSLILGIITDVKDLFAKEIAAARLEVKEDLRRTIAAGMLLGVGLAVAGMGGLLVALMAVHLLASIEQFSLWQSYGLVGMALLAAGAAMLYGVKRWARDIDFLPRESARTMKEDVQWIKNEIISTRK